jgi:SPASM domain peptide maturase of grasp-with-spasm system
MLHYTQENIFCLYSCCFPVKGFYRSCIYDIQRKNFDFIPNDLYDIILKYEGCTVETIKKAFNNTCDNTIDEYFELLFEREYIFFCNPDEVSLYPKIQKEFHYPATLSNALIDIGETIPYDLDDLYMQLSDLGCRHIQIRSYHSQALSFYEKLIKKQSLLNFQSVEFIIKYDPSFEEQRMINFVKKAIRIGMLVVHSSPFDKVVSDHSYGVQSILFTKTPFVEGHRYQFLNEDYFNLNINLFMEAHFYNPYFNQKVAISSNGDIKNCTSIDAFFGNIKKDKINDIVQGDNFQKLWKTKKDKITICKNCEYRYMCMDNRVPIKKGNTWIHTEKCAYDPHTAIWQ